MRRTALPACFTTLALLSLAAAPGQRIIAQATGLANPAQVIDFGANLLPNFTPITTQIPGLTITHASYFTTGVSNNLIGGFLTNDFGAGQPNTLRIRFQTPISDLSFVYHQIGTSQPSVFRAMLGATVVDTFSNLSNQSQTNNYFGWRNTVFDELQLDFVSDFNVDTLAFNHAGAYCRSRNGTGINPVAYTCQTRPILGSNWQSQIATTPNTILTYLAFANGPDPGTPLLGGEVLVQSSPAPVLVAGGPSWSVPIPNGPQWLDFLVSTQGLRLEASGPGVTFQLLNAIDLRLGR